MTSLRRRFAIWFLSATAILAMAAGAFLYLYVQSAIYSEFDSGLHAKLQVIGSLLRIENNGSYSMDFSSQSMPEYLVHRHPEYFEVFLSNGKPLERSESLKGQDLITPTAVDAGSGAWDIRLPDGQAGRAMAGWIRPLPDAEDQNEPGWQHAVASAPAPPELVVVAKERAGIDRVLSELMSALIVAAVVLTIGSIFAVQFVVNQALKPVNLLAERAKNVGPQTLDYRFDIDAMPQELKPIAQRLNDLLMRLDQAFSRQRRLNADIAHELRTPIAELRSLSDIASRWPGDRAQSAVYFHDAHEIALKMGSLVETLLALAHSQSGAVQPKRQVIDLRSLVEETLTPYRQQINERRLHVSIELSSDRQIVTDRMMFSRILDNIVSNAVAYAPREGTIELCAENHSNELLLTIGNSNESLSAEDLSEIFEPFWRKDSARSDGKHAGLGLTLVTEFAAQLGIVVACKLESETWFEVSLRIAQNSYVAQQSEDVDRHVAITIEKVDLTKC